ncbi:MAG TPA: carbohydrate binding domain-containing protein [Polyangiaceae bacterium]|nr:carbohydrate binding domain-containing protein [Polyangiaceae bacterium]
MMSGCALASCLVSFPDYPLDDGGTGGAPSAGGAASGDGGASAGAGGDSGGASGGSGGSDLGGASGGMSVSGASGMGGAISVDSTLLIDDFEDGNNLLAPIDGRNGPWFESNDGRGMQVPDPRGQILPVLLMPPRGTSLRGMHTTGAGFTLWGAYLAVHFVSNGEAGVPYDISKHTGITFSAKLGNGMVTPHVRFEISETNTAVTCTTCGDHFGTQVPLTVDWQTVTVPFSSLSQLGYGRPLQTAFDPTQALGLYFDWLTNENFDFWLDDVSFY